MSSPKHERDSDRESLTDWTLVDREGTPDKTTREGGGKDDDKDSGKSSTSPAKEETKKEEKQDEEDKEKKEAASGEEEDAEELSEDLISMGKRVQEIKACSGSDSSDIETLECPSPDDGYEDSNQGYSSLHSSLLSSSISGGFTFVEEADEGDVESLASSDVMVLDQEGKAGGDEETDLSLASSPSLPDDLPAIKPDTQYRHTPDKDFNSRLNIVVALTVACVLGLGLGHFLGWSSRSLWQENLNSAQVRRLRELQDDLLSCINSPPQGEAESRGPEYIPATSFIPVLPETEAEGTPNVDTFVESLVVPLEEAGVVLDPGKTLHHHQDDSHTYRHIHKSMEPTFATLDLLYSSSDPPVGQEETHSGLPDVPLATAVEDEIESVPEMTRTQEPVPEPLTTRAQEPVPEPLTTRAQEPIKEPLTTRAQEPEPLTTRIEEPALEETVAASPTNTPPLELNPEHVSVPLEQQGTEEPGLQSAVSEEDMLPALAVENSQIVEALNLENEQLKTEITRLQHENVSPIKISGKDGKDARNLRERITRLLEDNEELRVAVLRQQFDALPDGDTQAFSNALGTNHKLRLSVGKLTHLVPDLTTLKESANDLQKENQELQKQVGKLRYQEQPLPQELNVVAREVENLKKVVDEASKKKKPPANYENAKMYLAFMSQVLQTLHDFNEGGLVEKLDVATDVFEGLVPGNVKPSASVQQKMNAVRGKFKQLKASLGSKWEKIKELSRPQHLSQVSQDTLGKMNRVVINVVNKMKDIGQVSIMKRGKASLESTVTTLTQSLAALGNQLDKTWKNLEAQVDTEGKEATSDLLVGDEEVVPAEEEVVDEGEGKAKERGPKEGKEAAESKDQAPNKAKKVDKKSGGSGGGGRGGGRRGGQDGEDKTEGEEKKSKEKVEKKDKPDGRKDRSRSRSGDEEKKKEKKKKKEEKKKDNKEKSKKDKENKKIKEKEASGHKKEDKESRKSPEREDKRYHKGQYNKYDKKQQQRLDDDDDDDTTDESNSEPKPSRKLHKKKVYDDDDEDEDDSYKRKYQPKPEKDDDDDDEKKKGLLRHWEKPSRKNYRREYPGPKKAFIRRRGKNSTVHLRDEALEWMERRATGREVRRKEDHKSDWMFDRAKQRTDRRETEQKSEWQFDRARDRREQRGAQGEEKQRNYERNRHEKHEERPAKGRYVRFDDDDDDDYEFYRDYHHHHHQGRGRGEQKRPNKKGKREWVIPNFSATGKTFYH